MTEDHQARLQEAFSAHRSGDLARAEQAYRTVLAADPDMVPALANLGAICLATGRAEEALHWLDAAIAIRPGQAALHSNRAGALRALGRLEEALAASERAVALGPDVADAHNGLGLLLTDLGRQAEALVPLERAVALDPNQPAFRNNLGIALAAVARPDQALAAFRQALALAPDYPEALSNAASALRSLGRTEKARAACERALALAPGHLDALVNLGCILWDEGRDDAATALFDRALALDPGHIEAAWSRALLQIAQGDYRAGWRGAEVRWRRSNMRGAVSGTAAPLWLGETPVAGRTLLLRAEQGLGDTLQMLRYVPRLAAMGAQVVLAVHAPLVRLAATVPGAGAVVALDDPFPPHHLQTPMMSLPMAMETTLETVVWDGPYVAAAEDQAARWAGWLGPRDRKRVGLVWRGSPLHLNDRNRSLPLSALEPLLSQDATFVSLQKGCPPDERARLADLGILDPADGLGDFADTAAMVAGLDSVVAVDTAVAHLAGAMGKPVLMLLPHAGEYRWGRREETTPWYPTARLLRQTTPGDWSGPVTRAANLLAGL